MITALSVGKQAYQRLQHSCANEVTAALLTVPCHERGALAPCLHSFRVKPNAIGSSAAGMRTADELQHLACGNIDLDAAGVLLKLACSGSR